MSQYIAIAAIRIEHNYYNPPENSFVGLEPTPETKKLMRQRGVMLRQSRGNEWQWIMADDASGFADKDVLELSMIVKDPCFLQQIESDGYDPDCFETGRNGIGEVANALYESRAIGKRRDTGRKQCTIRSHKTRNKAVTGNLLSEIYYPILFLCVLLGVSVCIQG